MDLCVTLTYPNQTRVPVANEAAPTDAVRGDWGGEVSWAGGLAYLKSKVYVELRFMYTYS